MKKIFIYYSLSGNGDLVADYLKNQGFEIRKVKPKKELPKIMFFKMMKGGYLALRNYQDKLIDFDNDISIYDEVIIGSPIWNDRLSCPINTVLNSIDLNNKKISFILYSGSGNANTAISKLKENYLSSKIIVLKEPRSHKEELDKLKEL